MQFIEKISAAAKLQHAGGKAKSLQFLLRHRAAVPQSWVISWRAFQDAKQNKTAVLSTLRAQLDQMLDLNRSYAVRSSASVEDGEARSFAGQFASVLDVRGSDALLQAVETVWDSAEGKAINAYAAQLGVGSDSIKMAVIVQEMVNPHVSGVSFSKNPVTGLDETIVEAVQGSGEALLQGGAIPYRWVNKWGALTTKAETDGIPLHLIHDIVSETERLARAYGAPVDLEWVWDGTAVQFVQIRPITSMGQLNIYSNRISREVLPGIIKPLIWTVNVPLVNSAWLNLIAELIGPHNIKSNDLAKSFHYRAYFNMTTLGRVFTTLGMPVETLELMMGLEGGNEKPRFKPSRATYAYLPRMVRFLLHKLRFANIIERELPKIEAAFQRFAAVSLDEMDERALLAHIEALVALTQRMATFNVVGPLLMQVHNGRFQKQLEKLNFDYVNFDLMHGETSLNSFDPGAHLDDLSAQFAALPVKNQNAFREAIARGETAPDTPFGRAFARFVDRFGHFSDSGNDFSARPWREDLPFMLDMIVGHEQANGAAFEHNWQTIPLTRLQRWRLSGSYRRSRRFRLYRERISYDYTWGYGMFRDCFLTLADRFVQRGALIERDDIFYLRWDEVRALVDGRADFNPIEAVKTQRRQIDAVRNAILPSIIYGDEAPPLETSIEAQTIHKGIPTSRGYCEGAVCVINHIDEFDKMVPGAVLVIPFSDVSWTPLFAKAGAVIAEAGGMLSHSSIVAREYGIPAVVSLSHATRRFVDGDVVGVDGYRGTVTLRKTAVSQEQQI